MVSIPSGPVESFQADTQAAQRRANESVAPEDRGHAGELIRDLCDAYLAIAAPEQRQAIRQRVHNLLSLHHHLIGFIGFAASNIGRGGEAADNAVWLRRGLAATAIENNVLDYRDMYLALGDLYTAAHGKGIDPGEGVH